VLPNQDRPDTSYSDIHRWLVRHPRLHLHFTPTFGSWLNLVERWFAELTTKKIRLGAHTSV
jgi:transposase